jgi:hypothetical protein
MGVFFSVLERSGRNKQPRMPIFLPEFQPSVAEGAVNGFRMGLCVPSSCNKDEISMGLYLALNPSDSDSEYFYMANNGQQFMGRQGNSLGFWRQRFYCFVCHYSHWNISWNFDGSLVYFSRKNVKQR